MLLPIWYLAPFSGDGEDGEDGETVRQESLGTLGDGGEMIDYLTSDRFDLLVE